MLKTIGFSTILKNDNLATGQAIKSTYNTSNMAIYTLRTRLFNTNTSLLINNRLLYSNVHIIVSCFFKTYNAIIIMFTLTRWDNRKITQDPRALECNVHNSFVETICARIQYNDASEMIHYCFIDIEPTGKMARMQNWGKLTDRVPGIREMTAIVVRRDQLQQVAQDHNLRQIERYITMTRALRAKNLEKTMRLYNATNNEPFVEPQLPECVSFACTIKSLIQSSYSNLLVGLSSKYKNVLFVAHNCFSFDAKIIIKLLDQSEDRLELMFADSFLAARQMERHKRPGRLTNSELFKFAQTSFDNYFLMENIHSSLNDTLMMISWIANLNIDVSKFAATRSTLVKLYSKQLNSHTLTVKPNQRPKLLKPQVPS